MKRTSFFLLLFLCVFLCSGTLFAGDIAVFQNLGFSPDARYFMFAQHGIAEKNSAPYAELYVVDVAANRFAPEGTHIMQDSGSPPPATVQPGQDGLGALFTLLEKQTAVTKRYRIDHLRTGRLLYIHLNGEPPRKTLEFRDFESGKRYNIELAQSVSGAGAEIKASFHLRVTITDAAGSASAHTVGLPDYWRRGVKSYRLKQVLLGPDERSLAFVVEKEEVDTSGANIRYMVETLKP
jgi:predicted secreted protein